MSYKKFALMMTISFVVMYVVMFLNLDKAAHYHTSLTRIYMTLAMIAPMAIVMMLFMGKMYPRKKINAANIVSGIVVFIGILALWRTQVPISDVQYMRAMIPHHSSAIMTSKHANIKDPELREMADSIIASQKREIRTMEEMLERMR